MSKICATGNEAISFFASALSFLDEKRINERCDLKSIVSVVDENVFVWTGLYCVCGEMFARCQHRSHETTAFLCT